jgi:hypothetical protein
MSKRVFKQSAMTRPLFEDPTEEIERPDPWTGPKGFVIGGMALPTKEELSQQYFDAAKLLLDAIKRDELEDYKLVNPVLFLYRHSLELLLKSFVGSTGHSLASLAAAFEAAVKQRSGEAPPIWVLSRLREVSKIDPNSTAFRYSENYDQALKRHAPVDGELYVSLNHLGEAMNALNQALRSLWEIRL